MNEQQDGDQGPTAEQIAAAFGRITRAGGRFTVETVFDRQIDFVTVHQPGLKILAAVDCLVNYVGYRAIITH